MNTTYQQWGIIRFDSVLWEIIKGNKSLAIHAKTHKNLGDGGVHFQYDRYGRVRDYICGLRIDGKYRTNLPLKNEIICEIRIMMEPLDKHPNIPNVKDSTHYEYYLKYTEKTREKFYHQDIEDLCSKLLGTMEDFFEYKVFDKPGNVYHRIENDGKVISLGINEYWGESHLGYGWSYLLQADEQLLCDRLFYSSLK